jgi:hypothetical protein
MLLYKDDGLFLILILKTFIPYSIASPPFLDSPILKKDVVRSDPQEGGASRPS